MPFGQGIIGAAPRAECSFEFISEELARCWFAIRPLMGNAFTMMPEEMKVQPESAIPLVGHQWTYGFDESGSTVGSKTHQLVLVTVVRKTKVLGHRLIKNSKRMRK